MIIYSEFDIAVLTPLLKILVATAVGYIIGAERKQHQKTRGSRTIALVTLGATLLAILSLKLHADYNFDFVRLMS
jgi:putative Mg2+ transporter-C (MgtC) family protein